MRVEFGFEPTMNFGSRHAAARCRPSSVHESYPDLDDITLFADDFESVVGRQRPAMRSKSGRTVGSSTPSLQLFVDVLRMTVQMDPQSAAVPQETRRSVEMAPHLVEAATVDAVDDGPT